MDLYSKEIVLIIYFPHIDLMLDDINKKGGDRGDLVKWLGIALSDMLCLPYDEWANDKHILDKYEKELDKYSVILFQNAFNALKEFNPVSIRKLRLLSDGSLIFYLKG